MKKIIIGALFSCAFLAALASVRANATSSIVLSEIQTTGCREYQLSDPNICAIDEGKQEFIELFNTSSSEVNVNGWRVEYLSATHSGSGAPTRVMAELQGVVEPQSHVLVSSVGYIEGADLTFGTPSFSGYVAKSGGHIRLVGADGEVLDLLSWGSANKFTDWPKVNELKGGEVAHRLFPGDPLYSPASPFIIGKFTTPEAGGLQTLSCNGVELSEIYPNPIGTDTGHEFIEFHNPTTQPLLLAGCSVRINEGSSFTFTDEVIEAGGYLTLADNELGFTLPNSAGGTVWLITSDSEQGVQYAPDMKEGRSWALIEDNWKETTTATRGAPNLYTVEPIDGGKGGSSTSLLPCPAGKYRSPETNRCRTIAAASSAQPCRADQERNPETHRCRLKTTPATLAACKPGQIRSSETNRCRSATAASGSLTPCKPGQVRNASTNRCRSATAASTQLKPCAPGQERSTETNRCRKVISGGAGKEYKVEKSAASAEPPIGWIAAGTAGVGAAGYGAYEWRREIGGFISKFKNKISGGSPP